ncbi:uncharacterized protein [Parasteatoda tepidariorum]|uniref:uncharacterized protein n=1 Tax=Parasteatoda tepidariorum TaxID=114398 RepID=UPI0039BD3DF6
MPKLLEELLKLKRVVKSKVTRVTNSISDLLQDTELNVEHSDICLRQISELNLEVLDLFKDILVVCDEENYSDYETELFHLLNKLDSFELSLKKRNSNLTNAQSQTSAVAETPKAYINLPKLDLPTFSGDFFSRISFRDLSSATVRNNELLSDSQKLQYLKLSVKGEALSLINSIQVSDASFEKAWKALTNRYHSEVDLVYRHLDKLLTQPSLQIESAKCLRKLLNLSTACLDNLRILNQQVDNWDSILVYSLRRKIENASLKEWELSQTKGKMPTFEEFRSFLEMRARALLSTNMLLQIPKVRVEKAKIFKTQISPTKLECCIFCESLHSIYRCEKFLAKSVQERKLPFLK